MFLTNHRKLTILIIISHYHVWMLLSHIFPSTDFIYILSYLSDRTNCTYPNFLWHNKNLPLEKISIQFRKEWKLNCLCVCLSACVNEIPTLIFYVRMLLHTYAIWRIYVHVYGWRTALMDSILIDVINGQH
jgi:hypothetical protein